MAGSSAAAPVLAGFPWPSWSEVESALEARRALESHCAAVLNRSWDGESTNKMGRARLASGLGPEDVAKISKAVQVTLTWLAEYPVATEEDIAFHKHFLDKQVHFYKHRRIWHRASEILGSVPERGQA